MSSAKWRPFCLGLNKSMVVWWHAEWHWVGFDGDEHIKLITIVHYWYKPAFAAYILCISFQYLDWHSAWVFNAKIELIAVMQIVARVPKSFSLGYRVPLQTFLQVFDYKDETTVVRSSYLSDDNSFSLRIFISDQVLWQYWFLFGKLPS